MSHTYWNPEGGYTFSYEIQEQRDGAWWFGLHVIQTNSQGDLIKEEDRWHMRVYWDKPKLRGPIRRILDAIFK